eukprot:jgi/Chrzof1/12016/Cz06g18070.t1
MVRLRTRYLVLEVARKDGRTDGIRSEGLIHAVRDAVHEQYGDAGFSAALSALQVVYYNKITGATVLRCPRAQQKECATAVSKITLLDHKSVNINLLTVAGSAKTCKQAAVDSDEMLMRRLNLTAAVCFV